MRKLEIQLSDDDFERLKLAVTVEQKKIASDAEARVKAEEVMARSLEMYMHGQLQRLDQGTMR